MIGVDLDKHRELVFHSVALNGSKPNLSHGRTTLVVFLLDIFGFSAHGADEMHIGLENRIDHLVMQGSDLAPCGVGVTCTFGNIALLFEQTTLAAPSMSEGVWDTDFHTSFLADRKSIDILLRLIRGFNRNNVILTDVSASDRDTGIQFATAIFSVDQSNMRPDIFVAPIRMFALQKAVSQNQSTCRFAATRWRA